MRSFNNWMDGILDEKLQHAHKTVDRLMQDCGKHPITYNHYFIENVQKAIQNHREVELTKNLREFFGNGYGESGDQITKSTFRLKSLVTPLSSKTEADTDAYACIELSDRMQAYYKILYTFKPFLVALKTFIDNIAVQAAEGLIGSLWEIFSPSTVATMSVELIEKIEAETKMFPHHHEEENERASTGVSNPATPEHRGSGENAREAPVASPAFFETRSSRGMIRRSNEETYSVSEAEVFPDAPVMASAGQPAWRTWH